jgi:hypothetical protein
VEIDIRAYGSDYTEYVPNTKANLERNDKFYYTKNDTATWINYNE